MAADVNNRYSDADFRARRRAVRAAVRRRDRRPRRRRARYRPVEYGRHAVLDGRDPEGRVVVDGLCDLRGEFARAHVLSGCQDGLETDVRRHLLEDAVGDRRAGTSPDHAAVGVLGRLVEPVVLQREGVGRRQMTAGMMHVNGPNR